MDVRSSGDAENEKATSRGADSGQCADGMSPAVGAGACDGLAQDGGSAGVCHGCACCCHIGAESGSRKLEIFIELIVITGIVDASTKGDFVHGGAWRVGSSRRLLTFWLLGSASVLQLSQVHSRWVKPAKFRASLCEGEAMRCC
jgi:hypothetical protein